MLGIDAKNLAVIIEDLLGKKELVETTAGMESTAVRLGDPIQITFSRFFRLYTGERSCEHKQKEYLKTTEIQNTLRSEK